MIFTYCNLAKILEHTHNKGENKEKKEILDGNIRKAATLLL